VSEQWGQQPQDQPQYPVAPPIGGTYIGAPDYGVPYGPPRNSKLAIASLILGIVSIPLIIVGVLGSLVGLVGLVLGIIGIVGASRKNLKRGLGIAGIVLSVLGIIGGGLVTVAAVHAANACKSYNSKTDTSDYNACIKRNLKL